MAFTVYDATAVVTNYITDGIYAFNVCLHTFIYGDLSSLSGIDTYSIKSYIFTID